MEKSWNFVFEFLLEPCIGAVCSGSMLFASILNSSVMLGNYLQQTTSADDIFRCIFFLGALRANIIFVFRSDSVKKESAGKKRERTDLGEYQIRI